MDKEEIKALLAKFNEGQATEEEKALLETWYIRNSNESPLDLSAEDIEQDIQEVFDSLPKPQRIIVIWPRIIAAASVILCLSVGSYFVFHHQPRQQTAQNKIHDIAPGGNRAILTLSGGGTIDLSYAKNGKLTNQGSMVINKNSGGQIVYANSEKNSSSQNNEFNTVATPRGGQFQLILADGTKVWLNAASSLRYPVAFNGNERKVELTGEAYFEVEHSKEKPFRVISSGQEVEVLGTHFNINAYSDEKAVKTTLLEGSVKVSSGGKNKMLKPGEQAQLENGNILITGVDVNEVVAWKNGFFQFKDDNIRDIMRQLGRWYDVDIKYEGNLPDREFSGEISRNVNASQMLDILSFKKIHFRIERKTIVVMP